MPIIKSPSERPDETHCAGILPGSPGTRKTTLVKAIADILQWPLVTVPVSTIFEAGFDFMEARASEVFRRLNYLSGCVIFFDEFEEFFRTRGEASISTHDRTIAAFTTSAMLPRLQDLHDKGRCLIFLATNLEHQIDPAIKRSGRYDFILPIEHPNCKGIINYLDAPTRRTLGDIKLRVDDTKHEVHIKDKEKLKRFRDDVKDAVEKLCIRPRDRIRFSTIEAALEGVAKEVALEEVANLKPAQAKKKRVIAAMKAIQTSRSILQASEEGPPNLCDLP